MNFKSIIEYIFPYLNGIRKLKEYLSVENVNKVYEEGKKTVLDNDIELRADEVKDSTSFMKLPYKKS